MKLSWNSLKISIAGARLSHLVQKDKIWDHGSMTEQVRNIFNQIEKAKTKRDSQLIKKYVTARAFQQLDQLIREQKEISPVWKNTVITDLAIIEVNVSSGSSPDGFSALIKGRRKAEDKNGEIWKTQNQNSSLENFSERWHFIRQGEWWLLDEIKTKHPIP